jgi:hypothetical protein
VETAQILKIPAELAQRTLAEQRWEVEGRATVNRKVHAGFGPAAEGQHPRETAGKRLCRLALSKGEGPLDVSVPRDRSGRESGGRVSE